ncbi:MAG: urate hydroxylase PuuD [Sphingomicrobium sp.]
MAKFFANLWLVLLIGFAIALLIAAFPESGYRPPTGDVLNGALQWLHVLFGITWIGLLYYFNFVQTPVMPSVPAELKPGVSKYIVPRALFYFRWGAALTVLSGLLLAWSYGELVDALTLHASARLIGIGMWLALIMAFNVWVIIWPNQKKVLGLVVADDAAKAKAAATAGVASRLNVLLSIPMLLCMTNAH